MSTPEYIKRAQNKYNAKFDLIQLRLPKGTKERIKEITKESYNDYIKRVILEDLDRCNTNKTDTIQKEEQTRKIDESRESLSVEELYKIYGQKMDDIITQIEVKDKYGDDVFHELYKYSNI